MRTLGRTGLRLPSVGSRKVALFEPSLRAYEQLKRAGKTRFIGVITHDNEPEVIRAAAESGVWDVVVTAYNFRQSHREAVRRAARRVMLATIRLVSTGRLTGSRPMAQF